MGDQDHHQLLHLELLIMMTCLLSSGRFPLVSFPDRRVSPCRCSSDGPGSPTFMRQVSLNPSNLCRPSLLSPVQVLLNHYLRVDPTSPAEERLRPCWAPATLTRCPPPSPPDQSVHMLLTTGLHRQDNHAPFQERARSANVHVMLLRLC